MTPRQRERLAELQRTTRHEEPRRDGRGGTHAPDSDLVVIRLGWLDAVARGRIVAPTTEIEEMLEMAATAIAQVNRFHSRYDGSN